MDEVIYIDLREVVVDDPVHEVEAGEGHREHNPGVLVHVRGRHSQHAVDMAVPLCRQLIVQRHLVAVLYCCVVVLLLVWGPPDPSAVEVELHALEKK